MRASAWDDVWAGPAREGAAADVYIKWRVEGTDGMAQGTHRLAALSECSAQHH